MLGCWGYRIKLALTLNQKLLANCFKWVQSMNFCGTFKVQEPNRTISNQPYIWVSSSRRFGCNLHKGHTKVTLIWVINNRRTHTSALLREQLPFYLTVWISLIYLGMLLLQKNSSPHSKAKAAQPTAIQNLNKLINYLFYLNRPTVFMNSKSLECLTEIITRKVN